MCPLRPSALLVSALAALFLNAVAASVLAQPLEPGATYEIERFDDGDSDEECRDFCVQVVIPDCNAGPPFCVPEDDRNVTGLVVTTTDQLGAGDQRNYAWAKVWYEFDVSPGGDRKLRASLALWMAYDVDLFVAAGLGANSKWRAWLRVFESDAGGIEEMIFEDLAVRVECSGGDVFPVLCEVEEAERKPIPAEFDVVRGKHYRIELEIRCDITSGVVGADQECVSRANYQDIALTIEPDFLGLIEELREDLETHSHEYLTGRGAGHNKVKATTTPPTNIGDDTPAADPRASSSKKKGSKSKKSILKR